MGCPTSRAFREVGRWTADTGVGSVLRRRVTPPFTEKYTSKNFPEISLRSAPQPLFQPRDGHSRFLLLLASGATL